MLEVRGLTVGLKKTNHSILRDVSFSVEEGEILGLVGESGSGKTMVSLTTMGLLPQGIELREGSILLEGEELIGEDGRVHRTAHQMSMIFQNARSALNPTMRVGKQVARVLQVNQQLDKEKAEGLAIEMLVQAGIAGPEKVARAYPHQLSGGMCQRIMIAMALGCKARLLIADEPTTALDVTIQAQIFDLINALVATTGCGVLFITHDLGAVAEMCDRVVVMYGGQVMETASRDDLFSSPEHPYTGYLLDAVKKEVDHRVADVGANFRLRGCRFAHRCPYAFDMCNEFPPLFEVGPNHRAACFLLAEERVGTP